MRILFVGGVEMGRACVEKLLEEKASIVAIFCLPESQSHRSGYADFTPLEKKYNVPVYCFENVNRNEAVSKIRELHPDLILVIGWSGIIGEEILAIPKYGIIGHHPTLLPQHRGNAPISWALINGLSRSGVTLFFLEREIDRGDIVGQRAFDVSLDDDAQSLYKKATEETKGLLLEVLPKIEKGMLIRIPQDQTKASRWGKRKPEDGILDWNCISIYVHNWIRGLTHPYPGAFTFLGKRKLFIWKARLVHGSAVKRGPGTVISASSSLLVECGDGAIEIMRLQLEGEDEMDATFFIKKHQITEGTILG